MLLERFPAFPLRISATPRKYKIVFFIKFPYQTDRQKQNPCMFADE